MAAWGIAQEFPIESLDERVQGSAERRPTKDRTELVAPLALRHAPTFLVAPRNWNHSVEGAVLR
jgi:hypothetical protein